MDFGPDTALFAAHARCTPIKRVAACADASCFKSWVSRLNRQSQTSTRTLLVCTKWWKVVQCCNQLVVPMISLGLTNPAPDFQIGSNESQTHRRLLGLEEHRSAFQALSFGSGTFLCCQSCTASSCLLGMTVPCQGLLSPGINMSLCIIKLDLRDAS